MRVVATAKQFLQVTCIVTGAIHQSLRAEERIEYDRSTVDCNWISEWSECYLDPLAALLLTHISETFESLIAQD